MRTAQSTPDWFASLSPFEHARTASEKDLGASSSQFGRRLALNDPGACTGRAGSKANLLAD